MALARADDDDGGADANLVDRGASIDLYRRRLEATASWLIRSIERGRGGSCAYFLPLRGWSRPYPETTGYLIPTLLALSGKLRGFEGERHAVELGSWLLSIQDADGWWRGGLHPPDDDAKPSVFNTAQILQGLVALHERDGEPRWLDAAARGCRWLASGVDESGLWSHRDYRTTGTPSYYAYAAGPMLEVAVRNGDSESRQVAEGVLRAILSRRRANGTFEGWAPAASYVCLTGNAQLALCLLDLDRRQGDPRLVDTAARLVEAVCDAQRLRVPFAALRGAVGGSSPIWGRYMLLRYPNWAAKYHCDALIRLIER